MKKQIRKNVFETNSSSVHSLCLTSDSNIFKQEIIKYDQTWDFYNIKTFLENGEYNLLPQEVKEYLEYLDFDIKKMENDNDYFYDFRDNFNSSSGCGGDVEIDVNFLQDAYNRYNKHINITKEEFCNLISKDVNVENLVDIYVDEARPLTIKYIRDHCIVIGDAHEISNNLAKIWEIIDPFEVFEFYKEEIEKQGAENYKKQRLAWFLEYYEEHSEKALQEENECIKNEYPITYEYLKKQKIID